jgi:hypothetical protein
MAQSSISFEELTAGGSAPKQIPKQMPERFDFYRVSFSDLHYFSSLRETRPLTIKRMFGGLSFYQRRRMLLVLMQFPGDRRWKDREFDFDLWDGTLFPTDRKHHESLKKSFPQLIPHPVLGKWLYLPRASKSYPKVLKKIAPQVLKDQRFGTKVKPKTKKK